MNRQAGFTLIEIMVVVVILAILASAVVPSLMDNPDKARMVKAKQDIQTLEAALDMYRLDNFVYPSTDEGLEALVTSPGEGVKNWRSGGYVKRLPKDPWGNDYLYLNPGVKGAVDVFSYGADGVEGGEEANADIGNWDR